MTKYRTKWRQIEAVDVEKESDCSVWINGRREAKSSSFKYYFDTWDEAKAHLTMQAERRLAQADSARARALANLAEVHSLEPK